MEDAVFSMLLDCGGLDKKQLRKVAEMLSGMLDELVEQDEINTLVTVAKMHYSTLMR